MRSTRGFRPRVSLDQPPLLRPHSPYNTTGHSEPRTYTSYKLLLPPIETRDTSRSDVRSNSPIGGRGDWMKCPTEGVVGHTKAGMANILRFSAGAELSDIFYTRQQGRAALEVGRGEVGEDGYGCLRYTGRGGTAPVSLNLSDGQPFVTVLAVHGDGTRPPRE